MIKINNLNTNKLNRKKMNILKLTLAIAAIGVVFTSCKDDQKEIAEKQVDRFVTYVDSISKVSAKDIAQNWNTIERDYKNNMADANTAISTIKENSELQASIHKSSEQYAAYKADVEQMEAANFKLMMRKSLLGNNFNSGDMKFTWINKDNILSVYQNFVDTAQKNKDSYSREDWDELKLLYEAIDSRKNTLENEGLTSSDNIQIAGLKLKFAPMYTFNRMGAKSDENAAAKQ